MIQFLYNLFFNRSQFKLGETTEPKRPEFSSIPNNHGETFMKVYITVDDILTSSGKYPERAKHIECTELVKSNAAKLCDKVNNLLSDLKYNKPIKISSGFRPSAVNAGIANAAKKSLHMSSLACDIEDVDGSLDSLFFKDTTDVLLKKYGLWQEHPDNTKSWAHLDIRDRGARSKNVFKP